MKTKIALTMAAILGLALFVGGPVPAMADDFYKGKTIRFVVGFAPGGGYDLSARVIGRHMGKYIPGNPTIVVENQTGAGSLIAANNTYRADPDGLMVGIWNGAFVLRQALGDKAVRLDARKLGWIGSPTKGTPYCGIMARTGLKTWDDVKNAMAAGKELKFGATRAGSTYDDVPKILNKTLGTKFNVITGYEGTGPILVAMRSKEIDGGCWTWESARTSARSMLDSKGDDRIVPFLIHRRWEEPEVKNIPEIPEILKENKDALSMYKAWAGSYEFQRPFSVAPGVPKDRLQLLRKAFADTLKDEVFMAEAKKSKFAVTYTPGEEIEKYVDEILDMTPKAKEDLMFLVRKSKS
jgi:tripartite-type tricarboxylate transporter receptor subunit TctC